MKKIRVLLILPDANGGGAEKLVFSLMRNLDPSKYEFTLFLIWRRGALLSSIPPHVRLEIGSSDLKLRYCWPIVSWKAFRLARQHDIIVGALEFGATYVAQIAGWMAGKPVIAWVHIALQAAVKELSALRRIFVYLLYRRMENIVFVSHSAARTGCEWLRKSQQPNWRVIENCIEPITLPPQNTSGSKPTPSIIGIGRLKNQKGFDLLLSASAQLYRAGYAHEVILAGEGPEREALEALSTSLGIAHLVRFTGFRPDVATLLAEADIFVLSSRYEGFSLSLLEALAMGLPVVAADCLSGPAEILEGGEYGLLVPPENSEALAQAIIQLLETPSLRDEFRRKAPERAKHYSLDQFLDRWEKLLSSLWEEKCNQLSRNSRDI